jgi:hypothetical protein
LAGDNHQSTLTIAFANVLEYHIDKHICTDPYPKIHESARMVTGAQLDSLPIRMALQQMTPDALSIPEILSCVFSLLDVKTLQSAACVNHIWFEETTRLLWATSNTKKLMAVEASRRLIYAPKVREFTLQDNFGHPNLDLDFKMLRVLRFTEFPGPRDTNLSQYLQPALEEVHFRHWPPAVFLHGLNKHCPRLLMLVQTSATYKERPDLIDFFTSNHSLQCVQLTLIPLDEHETVAAMLALSRLPHLEDLTIVGETSMNSLAQLRSKSSFASVRRLKLTVEVSALSLLSRTFTAVSALSLDVLIKTETHTLDALASLPLKSLELRVAAGVTLSSQELLFLQNAGSLRSLIIKPQPFNPRGTMSTFSISNTHFEQIFEKLSALETLLIWFALDMPNSITIFSNLGQSCPRLENLRLYLSVDLMTWAHIPKPLFPNLKFAWISSVGDQIPVQAANEIMAGLMAHVLDRHAPRLNRFVAIKSYDFRPTNADGLSSLVMRMHGRIKETGQTRHVRDEARGTVIR